MIAYYILLVFFGLFSILSFRKFAMDGINNVQGIMMFISVIITAFAANKIF